MSEISVRPRVQAVVEQVPRVRGVDVADAISRALGAFAQAVQRSTRPVQTNAGPIVALSAAPVALPGPSRVLGRPVGPLTDVPSLQAATLEQLASTGLYVRDEARLQSALDSLRNAATPEAVVEAGRGAWAELRSQHQAVFTDSLREATLRAYARVELAGPREVLVTDSLVRLTAEHPSGKAIVTEIRVPAEGDPTMTSEVVGGNGKDCGALVEAFEKALAEEGVRGAPPVRKPTGGVCQLEAARALLRARLRPKPLSAPQSPSTTTPRRRAARPQSVKQR